MFIPLCCTLPREPEPSFSAATCGSRAAGTLWTGETFQYESVWGSKVEILEQVKNNINTVKDTLTGDVGDHGENEEGIIIEGEVILVGQSDRIEARLLNIRQSSIDGQKFSRHSHGVEYNKKCVSTDRCDINLHEFNAYTE